MKKIQRSPLRYPGGKSRATKEICAMIPKNEQILCSPFLGGASIEIACTTRMEVKGYDLFQPLIDFWNELMEDADRLANAVEKYYPLSKERFYNLQKTYTSLETSLDKATVFFVLNRTSFSGTTLSGGMSLNHPRFTESSIQRLRDFKVKNFTVQHSDFNNSIKTNSDTFLYLDPPYIISQKLYGLKGNTHKNFDHKGLARILNNRDKWLLSYNNCETVRKLYKNYRILDVAWSYGMNKSKKSSEVIILSHDLDNI